MEIPPLSHPHIQWKYPLCPPPYSMEVPPLSHPCIQWKYPLCPTPVFSRNTPLCPTWNVFQAASLDVAMLFFSLQEMPVTKKRKISLGIAQTVRELTFIAMGTASGSVLLYSVKNGDLYTMMVNYLTFFTHWCFFHWITDILHTIVCTILDNC